MEITIHRGTHEIGGTLIEIQTARTRILLDAGYPLFLNGAPIDTNLAGLPGAELLALGVLPKIAGLYAWDNREFDAIIISHAHLDHYGLLRFVRKDIPVYLSEGTKKLMEISQAIKISPEYQIWIHNFSMYQEFTVGDFRIKPYLMDHSAFDAAAFEICAEGKTVIYSGDFRGHGRKPACLDSFIRHTTKQADVLLAEGTMLGRTGEKVLTEDELETEIIDKIDKHRGIALFQSSSQNIDRLVTFYRAALRLGKTLVIDVYTANVLFELRLLGNNLPYPSEGYDLIKVFFPYRLTQKIFNEIGAAYAKRFSPFHISKEQVNKNQASIVMNVRPSMLPDSKKCNLNPGVFIYSLWQGYRENSYQRKFETHLKTLGFSTAALHTSGHASVEDLKRLISGINPKRVIPIHTMIPGAFSDIAGNAEIMADGVSFSV